MDSDTKKTVRKMRGESIEGKLNEQENTLLKKRNDAIVSLLFNNPK